MGALKRALGERMPKWGREYVDSASMREPKDRNGNSLGVKVFRAYSCEFGLFKNLQSAKGKSSPYQLTLTVDLRAKLQRSTSLLDTIYEGRDPNTFQLSNNNKNQAIRKFKGEVVIATYDKKCYSIVDLLFDKSPASMPVEGLGMSHAEYFKNKKNYEGQPIRLLYPNAKPLVAVLGRQNRTIYLPAELVCANERDPKLRQQLPMIASFKPDERNRAIEDIKRNLIPGAQKTRGTGGNLFPSLGIVLSDQRLSVPIDTIPLPMMIAAGVRIPERSGGNWAPVISQANYKLNPKAAVQLNAIIICHQDLVRFINPVYNRLAGIVNKFNASYRFGAKPHATIKVGDLERHWGEVEKYFASGGKMPKNIFVLDFSKPPRRAALDPAYPVVKMILSKGGYLSQFVNFNTYDHGDPRDEKKSNIILQGVARQVLSKCGYHIWWVNIPRGIPFPAVFVGVDVFHAPRKYDPKEKKRTAKESVAAFVVQVLTSAKPEESSNVLIYTETKKRDAGHEISLEKDLYKVVERALKYLKVGNPASCVVWRDGVGDPTIAQVAKKEIPYIRKALENQGTVGQQKAAKKVPISYLVCQKRISVKFISEDGTKGMPAGSCVRTLQKSYANDQDYPSFYINGTSPPYSTPKPVHFIMVKNENKEMNLKSMAELTWSLCHDYPNWTGPIKLPSPVQMAHKLAELAGLMTDCGESINHKAFVNKIHFL